MGLEPFIPTTPATEQRVTSGDVSQVIGSAAGGIVDIVNALRGRDRNVSDAAPQIVTVGGRGIDTSTALLIGGGVLGLALLYRASR